MSDNDDSQATGGDRATSARSRVAEISDNARRADGHTKLTHLMTDGNILGYGEDSTVDPEFSSTAISQETKRKLWDRSAERAILTAQNAEYGQIVYWRNITCCQNHYLRDEAHKLRRKAHCLSASENNRREFERFVENNGLICNHNQGEFGEWLILKPHFWIIDSIYESTAIVRPIYISQDNRHLHKSDVEEYVSIKNPWQRDVYEQQSAHTPLTID